MQFQPTIPGLVIERQLPEKPALKISLTARVEVIEKRLTCVEAENTLLRAQLQRLQPSW